MLNEKATIIILIVGLKKSYVICYIKLYKNE